MSETIHGDTGSADLATTNIVVGTTTSTSTKGGKTTTVRSTSTRSSNDGDDNRKKKRKRKRQIKNADELISAIHDLGDGQDGELREDIILAAQELDLSGLLPKEWGLMADTSTDKHQKQVLDPSAVLCMEFDPAGAIMAAVEGQSTDDGIMRLKVPFYIGNSVAKPSGWDEPLFFAAEDMPRIILAGKEQIKQGQMPLTVYARHSHAVTADYLPIGRVADVFAEGNTAYAHLEVLDDGHFGTQTQKLIKAGMLNSVSLRSKPGVDLELQTVKVNGDKMLSPKGMLLAGIDFAPEGPAMPTYGVQVLAEAVVEPITAATSTDEESDESAANEGDENTSQEEEPTDMEITLEAVKARADIVSAIEKPVRDEVATVTAERDAFKGRAEAAEAKLVTLESQVVADGISAAVKQAVASVEDKEQRKAAKETILAEVKDCKSVADAKAKIFDLMLEAGIKPGKSEGEDKDKGEKKTPREILAEAFGAKPKGQTRTEDENDDDKGVALVSAGSLPLPE